MTASRISCVKWAGWDAESTSPLSLTFLLTSIISYTQPHTPTSTMPILNVHAGSLPSFSLRMKTDGGLPALRERAAAKVRLELKDGIPLVLRYGWKGQTYTLEDGE